MEKHYPSKYISIRFEPDGFYLYMLDGSEVLASEFTACKPYSLEKDELVELFSGIVPDSSTVDVQCLSYPNVIIPDAFFQENLASQLLDFPDEKKKSSVLFNHLSEIQAVNVFGLEQNFVDAIREVFGVNEILSHITALLRKYIFSLRGDFVFVYANNEKSDVIAMKNGKLLICNSYKTDTSEDLAYYVVSVFNRFQLNPESDKVYYINDTLHPQLLDATKKFISHCIPV